MKKVIAKTTLTVNVFDHSGNIYPGEVVELDDMAAEILAAKNLVEILPGDYVETVVEEQPEAEIESEPKEIENGENSPDDPDN